MRACLKPQLHLRRHKSTYSPIHIAQPTPACPGRRAASISSSSSNRSPVAAAASSNSYKENPDLDEVVLDDAYYEEIGMTREQAMRQQQEVSTELGACARGRGEYVFACRKQGVPGSATNEKHKGSCLNGLACVSVTTCAPSPTHPTPTPPLSPAHVCFVYASCTDLSSQPPSPSPSSFIRHTIQLLVSVDPEAAPLMGGLDDLSSINPDSLPPDLRAAVESLEVYGPQVWCEWCWW